MKLYIQLALLFLVLGWTSCDSDSKEAAFLVIDDYTVEAFRAGQDETANFSDVWVILDNEPYGVWTLPARIPIEVTGGERQVLLAPGVRVNGVSGAARQYPFFDFYEVNQAFTNGEEVNITPRFEYFDIAEIGFEETFELQNAFSVDLDNDLSTAIVRTDSIARLGTYSGEVRLPGETGMMQTSTFLRYDADLLDGPNAYLELDVKGNMPLLVGYVTYGDFTFGDYKVVVRESDEWVKLYIDLSEELTAGGVDEYQILIGASLDELEISEGQVFIDNVRLLHF